MSFDYTSSNYYVINERTLSHLFKDSDCREEKEVQLNSTVLPRNPFYNTLIEAYNAASILVRTPQKDIFEAEFSYLNIGEKYFLHELWKNYIMKASQHLSLCDFSTSEMGVIFLSRKEEALKEIKTKFSPFHEIQSVYFVFDNNTFFFEVFLNTKQYNRKLVRKLLEFENEVEDNYSEFNFNFKHIPLPHVHKKEVLTIKHKKLFER